MYNLDIQLPAEAAAVLRHLADQDNMGSVTETVIQGIGLLAAAETGNTLRVSLCTLTGLVLSSSDIHLGTDGDVTAAKRDLTDNVYYIADDGTERTLI